MGKIIFVGDLEGDIDQLRQFDREDTAAIIQLGDFGLFNSYSSLKENPKYNPGHPNYKKILKHMSDLNNGRFKPFNTPVYFIKGGNEDFDLIYNKNNILKNHNITFVENGSKLTIEGINIACLGGIYSSRAYHTTISLGKLNSAGELRHKRFFTKDDIVSTLNMEEVDILVTHKAATGHLPHREEGAKVLNLLIDQLKPTMYFHAHHHKNYNKSDPDMRIAGLGNMSKSDAYHTVTSFGT